LIEAAVELFGTNGFVETSMRDLTAEVGIKAPAFYNHFKSKEEIFAEAITATLRNFNTAVIVGDDPNLPSLERLDGIVTRHVIYQIDNARIAKANDRMIESSVIEKIGPSQRDAIRRIMRSYLDTMTDIVTRVLKEAEKDTRDARISALAIGSMCDKVLSWYRPDGKYSKQKVAAHFCKLSRAMLLGGD
jgi:AcrR family transcriptional regulator